jgi:predicted RND superfamily exporter protein
VRYTINTQSSALPFIEKTARAIARYPWRVLIVVFVVTVLAAWGSSTLKIYTARNALFPKYIDVYQRLESFLQKFGAVSELVVVVEDAPQVELKEFATELAGRLRQRPEIRHAMERFDTRFILEHGYLLVPPEELSQFTSVLNGLVGVNAPISGAGWGEALERAANFLENPPALSSLDRDLQTTERRLSLFLFFFKQWYRFLESQETPKSIPWHEFISHQGTKRFVEEGGYFTSRDGKSLFMFVKSSNASEELDVIAPFVEAVKETVEVLRQEHSSASMQVPTVGLTGLPAVTYEEYVALQKDIVLILCTAGVLVLLLILLWLRSLKWALLVFVPMGLGTLFNLALTSVCIGHLTLLTSGFTAVLFGLGVDYGIFMSTRIIEELAKGRTLVDGIAKGVAASGKALITASMATVLIFIALTTVPFTGFAELGVVAGMGVFMIVLSTFVIQPALFAVLPPSWKPIRSFKKVPETEEKSFRIKLLRYGHVYLLVVAVVTAGVGAVWSTEIPFNYDVLAMLPKDSEAVYYQRKMVEESDFQAETVLFTTSTMEEARRLADEAAKLPSVGRVESLTYLFPPDAMTRAGQARRIGEIIAGSSYLKQLLTLGRAELTEKNMQQIEISLEKTELLIEDAAEMALSAGHEQLLEVLYQILSNLEKVRDELKENRERARERTQGYFHLLLHYAETGLGILETWTGANRLKPEDLPVQIRQRFFAEDGTVAVYAFPAQSVYDPDSLEQLVKEVYRVSKNVTGPPITHQWFSQVVLKRLRLSALLGVTMASIWILLMLRSIRGFLIVLFPLLIGGGWMMGILHLANITFNYANIISLPLMIGLAVDYGVWFGYRRLELKDLSPWRVAQKAGRAITLAAGTTLAGLGAIMLASYQGISLLGVTITIGLCCCLVAALVVSPALSQVLYRRKEGVR